MPRYALVDLTDTIVGFRSFSQALEPGKFNTRETAAVNGHPFLLPVTGTPPSFDPIMERLSPLDYTVLVDQVVLNQTVISLDGMTIEKNQDDQAAGIISERLGKRDVFAIATLMEVMKEMYQKLREIDPDWDLTSEIKRKAQNLLNALNP